MASLEIPILPIAGKPWGLSFYPLLFLGNNEAACGDIDSDEIRLKIGNLPRRGAVPDISSVKPLKAKYSALKVSVSGLSPLVAPARWPQLIPFCSSSTYRRSVELSVPGGRGLGPHSPPLPRRGHYR